MGAEPHPKRGFWVKTSASWDGARQKIRESWEEKRREEKRKEEEGERQYVRITDAKLKFYIPQRS